MQQSAKLCLRAALVATGAIAISASVWAQAQDFSKAVITTTKIGSNFYALGGSVSTIGVLVGPDGILMVDSSLVPSGAMY
jgi:hypothetical protein